jgi:hypothetical protein
LGATFTHNHPGGTTLSFQATDGQSSDLALAFTWGFAEIRAVTRQARYIATPIDRWPSLERLAKAIPVSGARAERAVKEMIRTDRLHISLYDHERLHQQMVELARILGFQYRREIS